jgi:uncharacterized protein YgbK (DUF1537 family)
MIVVLADDLTGAAEMGGIAFRYGLAAEIQTVFNSAANADLIVVDTDTRSCSTKEAAQRVAVVAEQCRQAGVEQVFKKVDSVLRGPVLAELTALLKAWGGNRILLVPANPSLGRTIRQGIYWVDDKSLHQTDFANDPEYPAITSNVKEILFQRSGADIVVQWPVDVLLPGEALPSYGIVIGESTCVEDLVRWTKNLDRGTIPAGAAEFFAAFLALNGYEPTQKISSEFAHSDGNLFVCGSTSIASRLFCQQCESSGTPVLRMPVELFDRSFRPTNLIGEWAKAAIQALQNHPQVVVAIDRPLHQISDLPQLLTGHLSTVVECILADYPVNHLFVEGGATAAALVQRLNWKQLRVKQELSPGVVSMQIEGRSRPLLTMKPGSYSWPTEVVLERSR